MSADQFITNIVTESYTRFPEDYANIAASQNYLHPVDYAVFVILLVASLGIGVFYACHGEGQNSTSEYLMGRRRLSVIPVAISMFMSYVSAIFVLGISAEVYKHGAQYSIAMVGSVLASLVSAYLFVPMFYRLKLVTSFEYLELRFQKRYVKRVGTVMSIIEAVFYIGVASFAPSTALEAVTGIPAWISIIMLGVVCTIYTTMGGMRAVVWTDVLQGVIYLFGLATVLVLGVIKVGGLSEVISISQQHGRMNFITEDSFSLDPSIRLTIWTMMFGRLFTSLSMALRQATVQRFCALQSTKEAYVSVLLTVPAIVVVYLIICLTGLTVFAYYAKIGCDPLRAGFISNSNQILPYFVINVLNIPGIPGLFLAVLYSGALSSVSSSLSSLAAVTWKDFLEHRYRHLSEMRKAFITKVLVFLYGILGVIIAFISQNLSGHVIMVSQSFLSSVGGPLHTTFIIGSFFPFVNALGAVACAVTGFLTGMWLSIGANISNYHRSFLPTVTQNCSLAANTTIAPIPADASGVFAPYRISFMLISVVAVTVGAVVGILVSWMSGSEKGREIDPAYMINFTEKFCCCLPRKGMFASSTEQLTEDEKKTKEEMVHLESTRSILETNGLGLSQKQLLTMKRN